MNIESKIPGDGYILPLWGMKSQYRATAIAYMKRENVLTVENSNGRFYTLGMLESALVGNK